MKTRLLYMAMLLLCLTGCLEKEAEEEPEKQVCQLLSSTTTLVNHEGSRFNYSLAYSYDKSGQLTSISSADTMLLNIRPEYDTQNRLVGERLNEYTWTSEYNAQNQLAKQTRTFEFAPDRYETYYLTHAYDSQNSLVASEYYAAESGGDVLLYTYRYTYSEGRLSGIEMKSEQETRHYFATLITDDIKNTIASATHAYALYVPRRNSACYGDANR